ncbi:MAG: 23S rRNA (adenine(2503)-C(2))-methyltransferase RlmN [Desulfobacteraceae bacterium]|nr:23S rRNA (adenine(2503)-C(2))-methyltransferase RlmN [Desulfobacteraceae bacterium]
MNILAMTYDQLAAHFRQHYGRGEFHAAALYKAFYHSKPFEVKNIPEFAASAQLSDQVSADLQYDLPIPVHEISEEGVTKLAFRLVDGLMVETVVIPMPHHTTICLSSQVGCRMGCRVCETGQMGLLRNLSAAEIVAQAYDVKVRLGLEVRNVVFMGMGEPLDNLDQVTQAIRVLNDQRGLDIPQRRITLSTCGLVEGIRRLSALNWPQLKLAVSLNAANDELRAVLMPVNRRHNLAELRQALQDYPLARGNVLFMEYVLIKGVNDHPDHARQLARYLEGLPVRLNLIAYNPRRQSPFEAPSAAEVEQFRQMLVEYRIFVRLRHSRGAGIRAACGQLGGAMV